MAERKEPASLTETQASGGTKLGQLRYMLLAGLVLVIVGFVFAYLLA